MLALNYPLLALFCYVAKVDAPIPTLGQRLKLNVVFLTYHVVANFLEIRWGQPREVISRHALKTP